MADLNAAWEKASPRAANFTIPMNLAGTPAICHKEQPIEADVRSVGATAERAG